MLRFTTNQGFEDIVVNELNSLMAREGLPAGTFESSPFGVRGNVLYRHEGDETAILPLARGMRSVYHTVRYLRHRDFEQLDFLSELGEFFGKLEIEELERAASFRVRCDRRGTHPFQSPAVERLAGGVLQSRYGTPVDLEEPECDVHVDIFGTHVFAGVRLTAPGADRRFSKPFHQRISTRSVVAYGMLNLSGILSKPAQLLDPFCGSGTILLEAADLIPGIDLYGCDTHAEAVQGTKENLSRLGADTRARILEGDARIMSELFPRESIGYIVTDPPLGIRMGKKLNFYRFYVDFLTEAKKVLPLGGRILMLSARRRHLLNFAVRDTGGYRIAHVRVIEYGGIFPALFLLVRQPE